MRYLARSFATWLVPLLAILVLLSTGESTFAQKGEKGGKAGNRGARGEGGEGVVGDGAAPDGVLVEGAAGNAPAGGRKRGAMPAGDKGAAADTPAGAEGNKGDAEKKPKKSFWDGLNPFSGGDKKPEDKPASGDDEGDEGDMSAGGVKWIKNFDKGLLQAKAEGMPIVVDFYAEWCGPCKMMDKQTFSDKKVADLLNGHFVAMKIDIDKFPNVPKGYNVAAYPTLVVMDENGKEIEKLVGFRDAPTLYDQLKKFGSKKKRDGSTMAADGEQLKKFMEAGDQAFNSAKYGAALAAYKEVVEKFPKSSDAVVAKDKIEEIEKLALAKLDEMKSSASLKSFARVASINAELQDVYAGTKASREAKELETGLLASPESSSAVRLAAGRAEIERALADLKDSKIAMGYDRLKKIAKDYKDVPKVLMEANDHIVILERDSYAMKKARDQLAIGQSKVWMSLARSWKRNGDIDRAKLYYGKVMSTFPETTFSEQAADEMRRP